MKPHHWAIVLILVILAAVWAYKHGKIPGVTAP